MSLVPNIKDNDWTSVRQAIQKIATIKLGPTSTPMFSGLTIIDVNKNIVLFVDSNEFYITQKTFVIGVGTAGFPMGLLLTITYPS